NLNSLPELLLLSGGTPIYYQKEIIGSIGISGGGSAENDDTIAQSVGIAEAGISTKKL
ncbi:heme-binding protein, partial [Flavobacterium sp.]|uniref:heme-binding protein n=1 Tax=Flavobacterium sp. TaxID=239 RepID=UPI0037BF857B